MTESDKLMVDVVSGGVVLATLVAWLPPLAALVTLMWGIIRIYETDTVQKLLGKKNDTGI